jgi:hypothetical protein
VNRYHIKFESDGPGKWNAIRHYKEEKGLDVKLFEVRFAEGKFSVCLSEPAPDLIVSVEDLEATIEFIKDHAKTAAASPSIAR